mmetsp:Transcript_1619/g.3436  ORF Transcript_1619/g.3436 Transcript_1619/m.3436 type:complete len:203 (-) Transcript_1619:109-717(-)
MRPRIPEPHRSLPVPYAHQPVRHRHPQRRRAPQIRARRRRQRLPKRTGHEVHAVHRIDEAPSAPPRHVQPRHAPVVQCCASGRGYAHLVMATVRGVEFYEALGAHQGGEFAVVGAQDGQGRHVAVKVAFEFQTEVGGVVHLHAGLVAAGGQDVAAVGRADDAAGVGGHAEVLEDVHRTVAVRTDAGTVASDRIGGGRRTGPG